MNVRGLKGQNILTPRRREFHDENMKEENSSISEEFCENRRSTCKELQESWNDYCIRVFGE